jgi:peptidoglycan/xylan/chitin deacetylase (PgdA/CDA1 family)
MLLALAIAIGAAAVLSHTAPAPFLFEAFRPARSLWRVEIPSGAAPTLFLTFDDGPNPAWTPALLDALKETGASATFFLIDAHITEETAPILRRIAREGHAIGLHSGSRKPTITPPATLAAQLTRAADRIASITGEPPCPMFRPHAGWRSATMYQALTAIDYRLVGWSWGMWDWDWWRTPQAGRVAPRLAKKARPGDIIVIHDGHHADPDADRRHAGATVRLLAPRCGRKGCRSAASAR